MKKQIKHIEKAIDALVTVQDDGHGCREFQDALHRLNSLIRELQEAH